MDLSATGNHGKRGGSSPEEPSDPVWVAYITPLE